MKGGQATVRLCGSTLTETLKFATLLTAERSLCSCGACLRFFLLLLKKCYDVHLILEKHFKKEN